MPHSSGGGSHGGGSHHSSSSHRSSHRSSGSGPSRRIRTGYFPGATRYRYYHRHKPRYVYANYDIRKGRSPLRLLMLLFYIPFFIAIVGMASETFRVPQRLSTDYDTSLVISDYINVLGDTKALETSMMAFYDETGITPAVFTVYPLTTGTGRVCRAMIHRTYSPPPKQTGSIPTCSDILRINPYPLPMP